MSKKIWLKLVIALLCVGVSVVWLLSVVMPEKFENFNPVWLITAFAGILGLSMILKGLFAKTLTYAKKFYIFLGAAFLVAAVLSLVGTLIEDKLVLPIIAIIITVAALLSILAVGGKKWDTADNEKVGYKNYYQRKAEAEKKKNNEN